MSVINLLDKRVYELIAAGEVIERPSSVVKELLENSVDAGAKNITVEIKNGGRTYIRVTDNGCGIESGDIPRAFLRHATSKIKHKDDLSSIMTLGFRGEALASVCAVSKIDMITKRPEDELGIHYQNEGGEELCFEDSGCPDGTTITVRDLFFNVPARLKFLKKDVSEGNAVANMVSKIALSRPDISFKFIRDNKTDFITSGDGKLLSAIYAVMGKDFSGSVIPVDYALNGVKVRGYVTKPLMSKANRAFQNFFVNYRYVKSVTCMVALEEAYRNEIMTGKFPGCVLLINIDPANVDVNVHPAKIEIRFSDEKPVYDAVYFAVKNALMTGDSPMEAEGIVITTPKKKRFNFNYMKENVFVPKKNLVEQLSFGSTPVLSLDTPDTPSEPPASRFSGNIFTQYAPDEFVRRDEPEEPEVSRPSVKFSYKYIDNSKLSSQKEREEAVEEALNDEKPESDTVPVEVIGEVFKTYIVAQREEEMFLIDKHAAHERYNFDLLKSQNAEVNIQSLLSPIELSLSYEAHSAVSEDLELLDRLGFQIELLDPPNVRIHGVPILMTEEDPTDLFTKLADSLASGKQSKGTEIYDDLFHSIACKASIKGNEISSLEELKKVVQMVVDNDIRYCPHGRPAIVKFTKHELEKLFKRSV